MSGHGNPVDGIVSFSENRSFTYLCDGNIFIGTVWVLLKYVMASNLSCSIVSLVINYSQQQMSVEPSFFSLKRVHI